MDELKQKNIDTSAIHLSGDRIGTYYLPNGADLKNAGVIYDRSYSSFASLLPGMIKWEDLLQDCSWFHFSAISPALNSNIAAVCKEGLEAAKKLGLTISVDLNYRSKRWQSGKTPVEVMPELTQYATLIMGNLWAAEKLLGIPSAIARSTGCSKDELIAAAAESMLQLHKQYPAAQTLAYTFRLEKDYFAVLQHGADLAVSGNHDISNAVDKAGSGDCFMDGLIYGIQNRHTAQRIIDYEAAAAVGKLFEAGDTTKQSIEDVTKRAQQFF
jgi:2-dehydro-3-deoxygluconokinase